MVSQKEVQIQSQGSPCGFNSQLSGIRVGFVSRFWLFPVGYRSTMCHVLLHFVVWSPLETALGKT
jgi:hypothetical protein